MEPLEVQAKIDAFRVDLQARGNIKKNEEYSANTIATYCDRVRVYLKQGHGWFWHRAGANTRTRNGYYFAIKRYNEFTGQRLGNQVKPLRLKVLGAPKRLSDTAIARCLASKLPHKERNLRTKAMFMFLLDTGVRISEALSLKRSDINQASMTVNVLGKGNKRRTVAVSPAALDALKAYWNSMLHESEWVFSGVAGRSFTRMGADRALDKWGKIHGIANLHAHLLRHTFGHIMVKNNANLKVLKETMGHADLKTTEIYTGVTEEMIRETHARCSPLSGK